MARRRGRITVQHQPTGGEQFMMRGMGLVHAVVGLVFVVVALTEIMPHAGLFGLPFLVGGGFFAVNGVRILVSKNDVAHRVGYDVETDLDRSIVGLMEDVPDTTREPVSPSPAVGSVQDRLEQLEGLKAAQLVTEEEYAAKRKEILEDL